VRNKVITEIDAQGKKVRYYEEDLKEVKRSFAEKEVWWLICG